MRRFTWILGLSFALSGCKTYNTILHNGPGKDVPKHWDYDELSPFEFMGDDPPTNLKKACPHGNWDTALLYNKWFSGWRVAVKCKK